jgi:DnaK suppressor protein
MTTPTTRTKQDTAKRGGARSVRSARTAAILGQNSEPATSSGRVAARWRWHYRALLSLQSRLLRERGELRNAVAEPLEPHSLDEADSATDEFDHDLALTRLSAEQDALYEVNQALRRILDNRYGLCEETGRTIPAARLKAVPWTRFTRETEERLEQQAVVVRTRLNQAKTVRQKGQIRLAAEEEAEETEEKPPALPNDEALSHVFSPPMPEVQRKGNSRRSRSRKAAKRKGRNK